MRKHLLIITQRVDEADDLLGFFVAWIREFAGQFESVDVIAMASGQYHLPSNVRVHSLGKEYGASKIQQALSMIRLLWRLTPAGGVVFAHMSPIFAIIAWPFSVVRRSRLALWYLHRSRTLRLRIAVMLAGVVFTADTKSLAISNKKIIAVGHGIDADRWRVARDWNLQGRPLRLLLVGRISPIKGVETYIEAAKIIRGQGRSVCARVVGRPVMSRDREYAKKLDHSAVEFIGFIPYRDMQTQYAWADIVVGCTPTGGIDKTLLEGMAAGCVVLTSNDAMRVYLGPYAEQLLFPHGDASALADSISSLDNHAMVSEAMVDSVKRFHALSNMISKISHTL